MYQRKITFELLADGSVTPSIPQYGGVKGEHNAVAVEFQMSTMGVYTEDDLVRLSFYTGDGTVVSTDLLDVHVDSVNNLAKVATELPKTLTMAGGQLCVRLVLSRVDENGCETAVLRSGEAVLYFDEAPVENGTPFWTGVSEMLKRTVTAKDAAVAAQETMTQSAQEAQEAAQTAANYAQAATAAMSAAASSLSHAQNAEKAALEHKDTAVEAAQAAGRYADAGEAAAQTAEQNAAASAAAVQTANAMRQDAQESAAAAQDAAEEAQKARTVANEAATMAFEQNKMAQQAAQAAEQAADNAAAAVEDKLDNSGHTPNMFLGTDADGNVVAVEAPSGGAAMTDDEIIAIVKNAGFARIYFGSDEMPEGYDIQIDPNGDTMDDSYIQGMIDKAIAAYNADAALYLEQASASLAEAKALLGNDEVVSE